ncbi:hypothetical protein ElyMa_000471400 [Elysia marginata]|uniref:Uncharacterized protein n=1 Tax=Elysia marginata TaxID=1093978 RepID=A0AAV4FTM5_9GAST|nr:hypothetical protein ElyMa_000471400 [Elysia marginata]
MKELENVLKKWNAKLPQRKCDTKAVTIRRCLTNQVSRCSRSERGLVPPLRERKPRTFISHAQYSLGGQNSEDLEKRVLNIVYLMLK